LLLLLLALPVQAACPPHPRSQAVLRQFQQLHPCPLTGKKTGACPGWVKDHIKPLACGGSDTIDNLQWQTVQEGKEKDAWERKLCPVCKGVKD